MRPVQLSESYKDKKKVAYRLNAGEGRFTKSTMPVDVALEMCQSAKRRKLVGKEVVLEERTYLPADMFNFGDEEIERPVPEKEQPKVQEPSPKKVDFRDSKAPKGE